MLPFSIFLDLRKFAIKNTLHRFFRPIYSQFSFIPQIPISDFSILKSGKKQVRNRGMSQMSVACGQNHKSHHKS